MTGAHVAILFGVFVGGATPWLEAIVVIPGGILAGGHAMPVAIAGIVGNLATVAVAAWFGERIRTWWIKRRLARRGDEEPAGHEGRRAQRGQRAERIARRWGLPALAALGPLGLGTQLSALVAVSIGTTARAAFAWIGAGTVVWSAIAAVLAITGVSIAGIGA
ncbi:small multi-drug export protein [Bounagaea algeriensis]